jgi:hypothetical protein
MIRADPEKPFTESTANTLEDMLAGSPPGAFQRSDRKQRLIQKSGEP